MSFVTYEFHDVCKLTFLSVTDVHCKNRSLIQSLMLMHSAIMAMCSLIVSNSLYHSIKSVLNQLVPLATDYLMLQLCLVRKKMMKMTVHGSCCSWM